MKPIGVVAGPDGRLLVKDAVVAFVEQPDVGLLKMLVKSRTTELFASVRTHLADRASPPPSFIVIDRTTNELLIHGNIAVENGIKLISGADPASFEERPWDSSEELRLDATKTGLAPLAFLREGCVPASGFVLKPEPGPTNSGAETPHQEPEQAMRPAANGTPAILDDPGIDLASIGRRPPVQPAPVQEPEVTSEDPPARQSPSPERDDSRASVHPLPGPDAAAPQGEPARRFRPPPSRDPETVSGANDDRRRTLDGPLVEPVALLRFSDGQSCEVAAGMFVGRYPSKRGIPDGYDTITLAGEEVSRVHVEVKVSKGRIFARDSDTANGSILRSNRGLSDLTAVKPGTELEPGDIIEFAGHRIFFDGWGTRG